MELREKTYAVANASGLLTPALLIYPEIVHANIAAAVRLAGGDPNRWRPHIKTVKSAAVLSQLFMQGVVNLKVSTTLELLLACRNGAADVLLAFPVTGANAARASEIAKEFPKTRVSILIESTGNVEFWRKQGIGMFIDVNPGMDRTGIPQEQIDRILALAREMGDYFRGLHYYDGHMNAPDYAEREKWAHEGYTQLMRIVHTLADDGIPVGEVITSGTPAAPCAISFEGFRDAPFVHRISPGTVIFNDLNSLKQLPGYGFAPAAVILATVVSKPTDNYVTCDGGHKSVSADSGVPTCAVIGRPGLTPLKPSEEHLPIEIAAGTEAPAIGDQLYLLPKHICPSVNNFDEALFVVDGQVRSVEPIGARGHERPLSIAAV